MVELLKKHLPYISDKLYTLEPLSAHASNRKYTRVIFNDGTSVLATLSSSVSEYRAYMYLEMLMREQNIPHPRILSYCTPDLFYVQEWVEGGDLLIKMKDSDYGEKIGHLYAAIDTLIAFQGMKCVRYALSYPTAVLDPINRFAYGLELLNEHDPEFYELLTIPDISVVNQKCSIMLAHNSWHETGVVHRDFNLRNLLFDSCCGIQIIDFQGFRRGTPAYDLVSLLQDTNLVPDEMRESVIEYYMQQKKYGLAEKRLFRKHCNAIMAIRDIEACGIVAMMVQKNAHPYFASVIEMYKKKAQFALKLIDSY